MAQAMPGSFLLPRSGTAMEWLSVRLRTNGPRGKAGDLVEAPSAVACEMVRDGRADPAGAMKAQRSAREEREETNGES